MKNFVIWLLLGVGLAGAACSDGEAGPTDPKAGSDAGECSEEEPDACVSEPSSWMGDNDCGGRETNEVCAPEFRDWECPDGWNVIPGLRDESGSEFSISRMDSFTACEPVWEKECPDDSMPELGSSECFSFAANCPQEEWPEESELRDRAEGFDGEVIYVGTAGSSDGSGTRADPFPDVAAALAAADDGDIVALGTGEHSSMNLEVGYRVALVGACATETKLVTPESSDPRTPLVIQADDVKVADITLSDASHGIAAIAGVGIELERVRVVNFELTGIDVEGSNTRASLNRVLVDGRVGPRALNGVLVLDSAGVEFSRVALLRAGFNALNVNAGNVRASDLIVTHAGGPAPEGLDERLIGNGVAATYSSQVSIDRGIVVGTEGSAVIAGFPGTSVTLRDVLIADTTRSNGLGVGFQASLVAERMMLTNNQDVALLVEGGSAELTNVEIRGTRASPESTAFGLLAEQAGSLTASRLALLENEGVALILADGIDANLEDVVVARTRPPPDDALKLAYGLFVESGAKVFGARVEFYENFGIGAFLTDDESELELENVTISDTANATLAEASRGLTAESGSVTLRHAMVLKNKGVGVEGIAADFTLQNVLVADTEAQNGRFGVGVSLIDGSSGTLRGFELSGNALAGLQLVNASTINASQGLIRQNLIGVNLQNASVDPDMDFTNVVVRDNDVNQDTQDLPLPQPPDFSDVLRAAGEKGAGG